MTKVCFCGASGNGISPLEQILIKKGYDVYGSDRSFDKGNDKSIRTALESVGLKIIPQDGSGITKDTSCLYVSSAIDETNPDIKAARELNVPIKKRSDLLAEIFHQYPKNIAISGTSGKTTTTAMVGYVLDTLKQKPCMINGGWLRNYENQPGLPNYIYNEGEICVIEADESDGSIRDYRPHIGLINNISHDHTSMENLMEYFTSFASHIKDTLVINADCPLATKMKSSKKNLYFSLQDKNADVYANNIKAIKNGIEYQIDGKTFHLQLIGRFNVSNAIAAICVCMALGIDKFEAAKALEGFTGIKRRLEVVGTNERNITLIDDFAHNPSKIFSSLEALQDYEGRLIVMYQSHSPFSAKNTGDEVGIALGKALKDEDIFIMPEVYMLNKETDIGISAQNIINKAKQSGVKNAVFVEDKAKVREFILANAKEGDRIVIMGARDNSLPDFSRQLLKELA